MTNLPPIPADAIGRITVSPKRKKRRSFRRHHPSAWLLLLLVAFSIGCSVLIETRSASNTSMNLSSSQLSALIADKAAEVGISDHLSELQAIVKVESNGQADDVFQSSESAGLPPNTLGVHDSIDQGVRYYKSLLDKAAALGVDQDAVFQAYNYGSGYLDFVAANGGHHTQALAEEFSKTYADGRIVSYPNPVAIDANGGWRYDYGNMFYVQLIHQHLG